MALLLVCALTAGTLPAQAVDPEAEVAQLKVQLREAGTLFNKRQFKESGELVRDVQQRLQKLLEAGGAGALDRLRPVHRSLTRAHALLELEGVKLPPLVPLDPDSSPPATAGKVSFVRQVAPVVIRKCGRCHVSNARGMFSMANFESLMKGPPAGVVVFAGDGNGSRLIEVIESGDMPRGGLNVAPEELALLKRWINEGARFDGENPQVALASLVPNLNPDPLPAVVVAAAKGDETVSFASDIAPVLLAECANCHGNAQRPRARFNLTTFRGLLSGGDSGPPVVPGKPGESLLIKKLKGTASGQRMPQGRPPLADGAIALVETWIREGARFDGPDATRPIAEVAELAKARSSSHDELSAQRVEAAERNWRLGMSDVSHATSQTNNFLLLGNVGQGTLVEYGERAERLVPRVAALLKAPADKPLIKGRMTLFVFNQRYDYSEFGRMVEQRQIPAPWRGHWRFTVVDAYGAVIPSRGDEYSTDALVAQQLAGVYVASLNAPPRWFAEGVARVVAARVEPDDSRVLGWKDELPRIVGSMSKPDDFLTGRLAAEDADIASYSFVDYLMRDTKRFRALLAALRDGQDFPISFAETYGGSPAQLASSWARQLKG